LSDEKYLGKVKENIPLGFVGEAEDCAGAALLFCSKAGRYITGSNLYIDGGMFLK
jgi:NAD(P)-dependent dehydrogenase (short-subunit alcohol dehydrogenase family)